MSQNILFNGVTYTIPDVADESWGENLTNFFVAIPQGALQKSSGNFTLIADVNFGASFGLLVAYLKSRAANISTAGLIRLAVGDTIGWRNNALGGNLLLAVDSSDRLTFNGAVLIPAGAGSIVNADISPSAAIAYSKLALALSIVNGDISASAAIALSKLAALTISRALVSDGSGIISVSAVTSTELAFISGVTSSILGKDQSGTVTNKTIAAGSNTITGLSGSNFANQSAATFLAGPTSGSAAAPSFKALQGPTTQKFTTGSGTYTTPAGVLFLKIIAVGAGAGSVGSGTAAGTVPSAGGDSFWRTTGDTNIIQSPGGAIGVFGANGGLGGGQPTISAGATDFGSRPGTQAGGQSYAGGTAFQAVGGNGGGNAFCGSGPGGGSAGNGASAVQVAGQGGAGPGANNLASGYTGMGGGGGAYAVAFISSPSASYHYVVGTAGGAGGAGTSGIAGAAGAPGIIIVEEYYQ